MEESRQMPYVLGLDIGSNSIGWAVLGVTDGKPCKVIQTGVRVFEAGMEGDIEKGREESRNKARREARLIRRQLWRRARRLKKLLHILQRASLLPAGEATEVIEKLDTDFRKRYEGVLGKHLMAQVLPYYLRKRALDEKLEPYELGRALYHLAQRRGFKSGRKAPKEKEGAEEKSKVKKEISDLAKEIAEKGARTLGEYFANLDPTDPNKRRIRERWTSRAMYEHEFEEIWKTQAEDNPGILTEELRKEIHKAIFFQRPLKPVEDTVGDCQFEKGKKRAPWALPSAQRFRYLQKVNDLKIIPPKEKERYLTDEQREKIINALERRKKLSFQDIRVLLGLKRNFSFNLQEGGEDKLKGNSTTSELIPIFGEENWKKLSREQHDLIVEEMLQIEQDAASYYWKHHSEKDVAEKAPKVEDEIVKLGGRYGLDAKSAGTLADVELEDEYCNLSREALAKLLPKMTEKVDIKGETRHRRYMEAVKDTYGKHALEVEVKDCLPPVLDCLGDLRNPTVMRSLTELRRVVNAIIREYGKPEKVHIELAREMKRNRKQREESWKKSREGEKERDAAEELAKKEMGISDPKEGIKLKIRLYQESNMHCPYCGKGFSYADLSRAEIDHIIPYSRSFDNSFVNKTLICRECNKDKLNRTPFESFGNTERWEEILNRVKNFKGRKDIVEEKLRRFEMEEGELQEFIDSFSSQQLNDTKYTSKVSRDYLALLYGGISDEKGLRVQAGRGGVTYVLRNVWQLNFLGGGVKTRDDHRQHAVDAVVIALTDHNKFQMLSNASQYVEKDRIAGFAKSKIELPWQGFKEEVEKNVRNIVVSHRVSKKVQGPLHEETFYSPPRDEHGHVEEDKGEYVHLRVKIESLTAKELDNIVDPVVSERVKQKIQELGGGEPKKVFKDKKDHPYLETKDGLKIPIHKVRIRRKQAVFPVAQGCRRRFVITGSNHHMEIREEKDKKGNIKWDAEVVSMLDAMQRLKRGEPVIKRNFGDGKKFLFSLAGGEIIELDEKEGRRSLYKIGTVPKSKQLVFIPINDARNQTDIPKSGRTGYPETLRKRNCRKVLVTPLGEVRRAND